MNSSRKILCQAVLSSLILLTACSKNSQSTSVENAIKSGVITASDAKSLLSFAQKESFEKSSKKANTLTFILMAKKGEYAQIAETLEKQGAVLRSDDKTGIIIFESSAQTALSLVDTDKVSAFLLDKEVSAKVTATSDTEAIPVASQYRSDLYPINVMKADKLRAKLKAERNIDVNGSDVTIVVTDTGLDISRTDVFQDRIVGLRSAKLTDAAFVTEAMIQDEAGKSFLTATIDGKQVKIERTQRLSAERTYYIGYISEAFLKSASGYELFDFNLDKKLDAIYPVVVYKNEAGIFEGFINVNAEETYSSLGDNSIEDENLLTDFNYANATRGNKRYVKNPKNPALDYYTDATRMDIADEKGRLSSDRTKGRVNLTFNIEKGFELDKNGNLKKYSEEDGKNIYRVGIAGYDPMGHGTHCAGSTSGNFLKAPQFNAAASASKIIGVPFLGGGATNATLVNSWLNALATSKNVVFSNSWGSTEERNLLGGPKGRIYDEITLKYNAPILFAAGNDGAGLGSLNTNASFYSFSIASMYNSDARNVFAAPNDLGTPTLQGGQYLVSNYSSRGPTFDGGLKPDFSAPGWVMSATPLIDEDALQFWTGTSMATPNAASAVAVLIDGLVKSGQKSPSIANLHAAIKNTAQEYDQYYARETIASDGQVFTNNKTKKFNWVEGGAGHVDVLKAFSLLETLNDKDTPTFITETESRISGINEQAFGYFAFDRVDRVIAFTVRLNAPNTLEGMTLAKTMNFKIPADIDWLSFDPKEDKKEMTDILVNNGHAGKLSLYIRPEKILAQNGNLLPGIHEAIIKGFDQENPDVFVTTFPVVLIGSATQFKSQTVGAENFSVEGFIQAGQILRYFVPVASKDVVTTFDLNVSNLQPGNIFMHIYKDGVAVDVKNLEARGYRASTAIQTSHSSTIGANNQLTFVLKDVPEGVYEVVVEAASFVSWADSVNKDAPYGSHFALSVSRHIVTVDALSYTKTPAGAVVKMENVTNRGNAFVLRKANVSASNFKKTDTVSVNEGERVSVAINVPAGISALQLETSYEGTQTMDIDIYLYDAAGKQIATSAGGSADEKIVANVSAGNYTLVIDGYAIGNDEKRETFNLSINQKLQNPVVLTDKFVVQDTMKDLSSGLLWTHGKAFTLKANISQAALDKLPKMDGYTLITKALFLAGTNNGKDYVVLQREFQ